MADGTKQEETPAPAEGAQKHGESNIVLFLVRHARGVHNYAAGLHGVEAYKKWEYEDARLDDAGKAQAAKLQSEFAKANIKLDVVLCSPLTRTLQTATIAFKHSAAPIVAVECLREAYGAHPCDRRRPRSVIQGEFPKVDMTKIAKGEDPLWTEQRETYKSVIQRAAKFVQVLRALPATTTHIAVVSHGVFLDCLLRYCLQVPQGFDTSHFGNAEVRALRLELGATKQGIH